MTVDKATEIVASPVSETTVQNMASSAVTSPGLKMQKSMDSPNATTRLPELEKHENPFSDRQMLMRNGHYSKGSAYTVLERRKYGLEGLLPHQVETLEIQVERAYKHFKYFGDAMAKYFYLSALKERSDTIFYALLKKHITEVMPYIYTPTVGTVCQNFGQNFRSSEGMYVSLHDNLKRVLNNWNPGGYMPNGEEISPAIIVITDGSRILGLGDLGTNGMGIPIGKLALYTAVGGFHPMSCLPITVDVGTNNQSLLEDPFYMGNRVLRPEPEVYMQFMDKLITTLSQQWPEAVIQFEDIENQYCFDLLNKYRDSYRLFNDDIQGTGVVTAAATLSAMKIQQKECNINIKDHRMVIYGFGSAALGVAEQIASCIQERTGMSMEEIRKMFYMLDSRGLVTMKREGLASYKLDYARSENDIKDGMDLIETIKAVKPTILIGLAGQERTFTKEVCEEMCKSVDRPAIFALSNPTSKAEVLFQDAYKWTKGKVIYCAGSPMEPVTRPDGALQNCSQCNNLYAFPGIGFGAWLCQTTKVTDTMLTAAANVIADMTSRQQLQSGLLFPPLEQVCDVSDAIAVAVIKRAINEGTCDMEVNENITIEDIPKLRRYKAEYTKLSY